MANATETCTDENKEERSGATKSEQETIKCRLEANTTTLKSTTSWMMIMFTNTKNRNTKIKNQLFSSLFYGPDQNLIYLFFNHTKVDNFTKKVLFIYILQVAVDELHVHFLMIARVLRGWFVVHVRLSAARNLILVIGTTRTIFGLVCRSFQFSGFGFFRIFRYFVTEPYPNRTRAQ